MASSQEICAASPHHAVAVPLPAQGHINQLMRLCKLLASRHAVLITFVNVDPIHDRLLDLHHHHKQPSEPETLAGDNDADLRIRLVHVALPALDLSNNYRLSLETLMETQQGISAGLESLIRSLHPPATCIISDFCMTLPTQLVADRVGIPRVMLFPLNQSFHMFTWHLLHGRLPQASIMAQECRPKTYLDPALEGQLEGLVPLNRRDLPCFKHVVDDTVYMYRFMARESKVAFERAHAILVNSFPELERDGIAAYRRLPGNPPLYPVGPLIENLTNESNTSLWEEDDACLLWLDRQPLSSVLYISFGSVALLSEDQFTHMLSGLQSSNQRFLWSCRPDLLQESSAAILQDFLQKAGDRGYSAAWVPQLSVLKHPSVGAFLTHCGWNSTIEGVATGVPLLCWPYFADQFMNAKYIVEVWEAGLAFQHPTDGSEVIRAEEIDKCIRAIMEGERGKVVRENMGRLKEAAAKCHEEGGSSEHSLEAFVQGLPRNSQKP